MACIFLQLGEQNDHTLTYVFFLCLINRAIWITQSTSVPRTHLYIYTMNKSQKWDKKRKRAGRTSLTLWHWLKWAIAVCENGNVPIRFNCSLTESVWAPFWIILAHFNPPADNNLPDTRRLCECNWMYVFQIQSELGKMVKQTGAIW